MQAQQQTIEKVLLLNKSDYAFLSFLSLLKFNYNLINLPF